MKVKINSRLRYLIQILSLVVFLSPLLRLIKIEVSTSSLVIYGFSVERTNLYIFVIFLLVFFLVFFWASVKLGRVFCAYSCPVHLYLEKRIKYKKKIIFHLIFFFFPPLLAQSMISFVFSYQEQWNFYQNQDFPPVILVILLIFTAIFYGIFYYYRETFCRRACPYSILQNLMQMEETAVLTFDKDGGCIDCKLCDFNCPMKLKVREESAGVMCTNCCLCQEACKRALGEGKEVLHLIRKIED